MPNCILVIIILFQVINKESEWILLKVDAYSTWLDYVFETNYDLMSLKLTEKYILGNKHLLRVPSAKEVKEDGIELAEMNAILLQKVGGLTLHLIELQQQVNQLQNGQ